MYDEPARPSPTPAPIAPPARARPPPTKAPAVLMAESREVSAATVSPWFRAASPAQRVYLWGGSSGCSAHELWFAFLVVRRRGVVRGRHRVGLVVLVVLAVAAAACHAEVEDGQQREDEGL